ncbi:MAG TPA: ATP-binding protein [Candidatus Binataceae bacterium]|nr:ATP-binding protein [Candidatus Binataceae bacterium]
MASPDTRYGESGGESRGRWRIQHLQTRFIVAGALIVMTTIVSGLWSAWTFARLSTVTGRTLQSSHEIGDLTATLSNALEREDDAFLLAMNGQPDQAQLKLRAERERFDNTYDRLVTTLSEPDEKSAAAALQEDARKYRAAGDALLAMAGQQNAAIGYQQSVNPALRLAVADCSRIRELNFRSMRVAAIEARDEAHGATIMVIAISAVALIISTIVALLLARSVLYPVRELSSSVEALRLGDFDRRVRIISADELGQLAIGFNRMAEALAAFRQSNLGEVLRAKETLEATIAALPDAVIVIDPDGQIVARNPLAKSVLAAIGAAHAQSIEDLPSPQTIFPTLKAALRGEYSNETRAEFGRAFSVSLNGRNLKFMLTAVPIPEFWKGSFGAVMILYDVTDFAQLDELRMELVGVASHELKTPLTTLRMNLMMMGEAADQFMPRQREMLTAALLGCQELATTIDELLDLTRIESGQLRLARDPIDLYSVARRAMGSLRQRFDDAAVTVRLIPEYGRAVIRGDAARLGMVFSNLLSNALKYTPRGGTVSIRLMPDRYGTAPNGRILQVVVTDTGPGIPSVFRERVFDKFFRVEQATAAGLASNWGSGIGLYLCRQIIEAHGGRISCEAGESGSGTRIVIALPSDGPLLN